MTVFRKTEEEPRARRADFQKSKPSRVFRADALESQRLEMRTLLTVTATSFPIPLVEIVQPEGITTGPDGNLWFTESGAGRIGRMTSSGTLTEFDLPSVPPPAGSPAGTPDTQVTPEAITAGPDGALWFTTANSEIGRIETDGTITMFPVDGLTSMASGPGGPTTNPSDITVGSDGALWFTGVAGKVGRITTAGVVTEFSVPSIPPAAGSSPGTPSTPATLTAITAGPDGALWFTGEPGEVGRITTAGVVTEFPVPDNPPPSGSPAGTAGSPAILQSIAAGPDGALWFTGQSDQVGRITTAGVVTEFSVPDAPPLQGPTPATLLSDPSIQTIVAGPDGNLWFTTSSNLTSTSTTGSNLVGGNPAIGRLTPTGVFTFFNVPGFFNSLADLTLGPNGNLWFTEQEDGSNGGRTARHRRDYA